MYVVCVDCARAFMVAAVDGPWNAESGDCTTALGKAGVVVGCVEGEPNFAEHAEDYYVNGVFADPSCAIPVHYDLKVIYKCQKLSDGASAAAVAAAAAKSLLLMFCVCLFVCSLVIQFVVIF